MMHVFRIFLPFSCVIIMAVVLIMSGDNVGADYAPLTPSADETKNGEKFCDIHLDGFEPLHALMDQICELCHDFFSHQRPNTRVQCRADCFRTITFKKCLRLFRSNNNRSRRHLYLML